MPRYISDAVVENLALTYGVTTEQVMTFIRTQRENGNIASVYNYINANPGVTDVQIGQNAAGAAIDATTLARILTLLETTGWIAEF